MSLVLWTAVVSSCLLGVWTATAIFSFLSCPRPMPDPSFPWYRCSTSCEWCDHMDKWLKEELQQQPALGPYRGGPCRY